VPGQQPLRFPEPEAAQPLTNLMAAAKAGTLPKLSWIVPDPKDSEHPPALISTSEAYVTRIINAVMRSRDWRSSAIFQAWLPELGAVALRHLGDS
jgi:phospholipase C